MHDLKELEIYNCLVINHSQIIPQRSRLYSLKPLGVGTLYTESLSSYLTRLAQEHCVTPKKLIMGEIAPLIMGDKYRSQMLLKNVSTLFGNSDGLPAINGMRDMTESLTLALESLTLREDLRYLSFLTWREIIKERGLFRQNKAWCPQCFEARRQENKSIYEPLLWSFKDVNYCSEHYCQLVDRCLDCDSQFKAISNNSIIGFCSSCKRWLGSKSKSVTSFNESALITKCPLKGINIPKGIFISEVGNLIAIVPGLNHQSTLSDVMRKLQLIHFCFERVVERDLTKFIVLGKIIEQLKITFTQHYDKPLNLINLLIPVCHAANISVALLFQKDFQGLGNILVSNLKINCKF